MSMRLRPFGRTGLMVSPFTLGTMEFGSKVDESVASQLLDWVVESIVVGPRTIDQLTGQLAALDVAIDDELLARIDQIVPAGGVTVPYYLDDSFADFRPQPFRW
jgi:aryl-alcohol dehydrogenase-like predicted oxidoreductase